MYVSRYTSRPLVPSSVINSAKREVFVNRQKQVGEKQVEIKIVIHGNSISGRPKGNNTREKTQTSKTPVRGKTTKQKQGSKQAI